MFTSVSTSPAASTTAPRTAVLTIAERTSAADQSACRPRTTAAEPARGGVAIDVPFLNPKHGGVGQKRAGSDDSTLTPGARTSGLTRKSTSVGPALEKSPMMSSPAGVYTNVGTA